MNPPDDRLESRPATPDAGVAVRRAGPDDAPAIATLLAELGYPFDASVIAERFARLTNPTDAVLLAMRGSEAIGLATLHATPVLHRPTSVGRITSLVVSATVRGQGTGRALMAAAEALLRDNGCALIEVTSNRSRTEAHAFYERLGYTATSFRFAKTVQSTDG